MKKLILSALALFCAGSAFAIPAYHGLITKQLPNGSSIEVRLVGDENFHYTTLADGTIIKKAADGYYYYASVTDNGIEQTKYKVGATMPMGIKAANNTLEETNAKLGKIYEKRAEARKKISEIRKAANPSGANRGLVIMVNFSDVKFSLDKKIFEDALNEPGYTGESSTGSAVDYFEDSSYGKYTPTFDLLGPYTLSRSMTYYGGNDYFGEDRNPTEMIVEACKLAAADGNDLSVYDYDKDGKLDNVYVFYAGEGEATSGDENTIWPHRWVVKPGVTFSGSLEDTKVSGVYVYDYACSNELNLSYYNATGSKFDGVGTFIHEFGHVLGLPDLYLTTYSGTHMTLDIYDVMDGASYLNYSRTPVSYSAYERMFMGWLTPTQIHPSLEGSTFDLPTINHGEALLLTTDGTEHNMDGASPNPAEFYLIENKSGEGWDRYADFNSAPAYNTPGDKGLLITHIRYNKTKWEENTVNNTARDMGVSYVYNSNQIKSTVTGGYVVYSNFYPMMPGKFGIKSVSFGNYNITDITRDDITGNVKFTINDKTAEPGGGVEDLNTQKLVAIGGIGEIYSNGNAESMRVMNIAGATIYNGKAERIAAEPGIYIVILNSNAETTTTKVIVR